MSAPTTLFGLCCAREVVEYCFCRCIEYGPRYCGLTCAPCLTFPVRSLVLTERASLVDLVLVGSECASWRRAVSRGLVHPQSETWVEVESSALARPSGRRGHPEVG